VIQYLETFGCYQKVATFLFASAIHEAQKIRKYIYTFFIYIFIYVYVYIYIIYIYYMYMYIYILYTYILYIYPLSGDLYIYNQIDDDR
jgi:hypothetical protein